MSVQQEDDSPRITNPEIIVPKEPNKPSRSSVDDPRRHKEELQRWSQRMRRKTSSYIRQQQQTKQQPQPDPPVTAAALIRLAFHDAIASPHQPNNGSIQYELAWPENRGLARPLALVQEWYHQSRPPPSSSLADAIALVAAQALQDLGGPVINIRLGRTDATRADAASLAQPLQITDNPRSRVTQTLPEASLDADGLVAYFESLHGFARDEWIALCVIHGLGRHVSLLNMPRECLRNLTRTCLEDAPTLLPFVTAGEGQFSNAYFRALLEWNDRNITLGQVAFIPTDVVLVVNADLYPYVQQFANDPVLYRKTFQRAFQKLLEGDDTISEEVTRLLTAERY